MGRTAHQPPEAFSYGATMKPSTRAYGFSRLGLALAAAGVLVWPALASISGLNSSICPFLHLTGRPCPFCGLTRSLAALETGRFMDAVIQYPLSPLVFLTAAAAFIVNMLGFIRSGRRRPFFIPPSPIRKNIFPLAVLLFSANWVYRLFFGLY